MRLTGTPSYTAPLCPGARSHTMILTPCSAQLRTTGAMETAFMFSVQFQMIWPSIPLTANQSATVEPCFTSPIVLANTRNLGYNT